MFEPIPRRMPQMKEIIAYWREHVDEIPTLRRIGWGEPFCFACGWLAPGLRPRWDTKWFDRAHLEDHAEHGNDEVSNIVPMCHLCHDEMPSFRQRENGLAWVIDRPLRDPRWQLFTDYYFELKQPGRVRVTTMLRARAVYYEQWVPAIGSIITKPTSPED